MHTIKLTVWKQLCSLVSSNILDQLDSGSEVYLLLLGLSTAFDTVDHKQLLKVLTDEFAVGGVALSWFQSYLHDRSFKVRCGRFTSRHVPLETGIQQGSILSLIIFNCYTTVLVVKLESFGVQYHLYTDDIPL